MGIIGIVLGVVAFLISQSILMDYVPMEEPQYWTISLVVAAWVSWPFFRLFKEHKFDTLSPRARIHDMQVAQAFSKIVQIFDESSISGRKFDVYVRNTTARRICARMTWRDDKTSLDGSGTGPANINISTKNESTECCVEVEINLQPKENKTVMIMDWRPILGGFRTEGIINDASKRIFDAIGHGEVYESEQPRTYTPGPPIALVLASAFACFMLLSGIEAVHEKKKQDYVGRVDQLASDDTKEDKRRELMQKEIDAWNAFKRRKGI